MSNVVPLRNLDTAPVELSATPAGMFEAQCVRSGCTWVAEHPMPFYAAHVAWRDHPCAVYVHRAHPATSGPFCVAYRNDLPTMAETRPRSTFVQADVTCPNCLRTYEPGGDDPRRLSQPRRV